MRYVVSRQHYYGTGAYGVEVVQGEDESSPDMLTAHYPGEGTYNLAMEAVDAAIDTLHAWRKDSPTLSIELYGFTTLGGMLDTEEVSEARARAWAKKKDASVPRCDYCGCSVPSGEMYSSDMLEDELFCSEYCLEARYVGAYPQEEEED